MYRYCYALAFSEIASACVTHCTTIVRTYKIEYQPERPFAVNTITDNISCAFCGSYAELLALVFKLDEMLNQNKNIRLIVIDSFSHLLREVGSSLNRVRIVNQLLSDLQSLAKRYQCAVSRQNGICNIYTAR